MENKVVFGLKKVHYSVITEDSSGKSHTVRQQNYQEQLK